MGNLNELDYIRMQISSVNVKPINPIIGKAGINNQSPPV